MTDRCEPAMTARRRTRGRHVWLAIWLSPWLCACAGTPADAPRGTTFGAPGVVYLDCELRAVVDVEPVTRERIPGTGLLRVRAPIRNLGVEPLRLLVQVEFLDADGLVCGDDTPYRVVALRPGETAVLTVTSTRSNAADAVVRVRHHR
jgi:hypothetical protein